jgi:opacity protein-like surface antigen
MKIQLLATALLATASLCHAGEAIAESTAVTPATATDSGWDFRLAVYVPMMGLEGDIAVGAIATSVDVPFDDILEDLDGGFMTAFEARRNRWSITSDLIWLKLSGSSQPTANTYVGFKQEQIMASVSLGYELFGNESTTLDLLGGAALTRLDVDLDATLAPPGPVLPTVSRQASGSETWVDPFIGLRVRHRLSERWSIFATGIYGGFGVASDEYWQALAGIGFHLTENATLALAYRVISTDYQDGRFSYDVENSGPNLGLVFRF